MPDQWVEGGVAAFEFFTRFFGSPLRGEGRKFAAVVYPVMKLQAQRTNSPVLAFWFGDVLQVNPDGSSGKAQEGRVFRDIGEARAFYAELAKALFFYELVCDNVNLKGATAETLNNQCTFRQYGSAVQGLGNVPGAIGGEINRILGNDAAGNDPTILFLLLGVGLLLFLSRKSS